jgi:glycyl-tRNA synthetase
MALRRELKRNIKEAWWREMVTAHDDTVAPPALHPPSPWWSRLQHCYHPQVWSSGHYDLFDLLVDCRTEGCKARFRADLKTGQCPPAEQTPG